MGRRMDPDERMIAPALRRVFSAAVTAPLRALTGAEPVSYSESVPSCPEVPLRSRLTIAFRRWRRANSTRALIPGRRRDPCYHPPITVVRAGWT
jgi:hypothetical protein